VRLLPTPLSLQRLLTVPFVALVVVLALVIGALSYSAGSAAVDTVSDKLLKETVQRIGQAIERHVVGSGAVLEAAFPNGIRAPVDLATETAALRTRFWIATSLHRDPNNYVYYGNKSGQFIGLWRHSADDAELRLKFKADEPRAIQRFSGINGELQPPQREQRLYDPRQRPWYQAGMRTDLQTWTAIYVDFRTQELVATRARRVPGADGAVEGVVATDVSLRALDDFVRRLKVSDNGFAFIVEPGGQLIAASNAVNLKRKADGTADRVNAAESGQPVLEATYRRLQPLLAGASLAQPGSLRFEGPGGRTFEAGYARVVDTAGLDWSVVVAVPREDFMAGVSANVVRTMIAGLLAALAVVAIGSIIMQWIARDVRRLADAARRIGEGDLHTPLAPQRTAELGMLAQSFERMQTSLRTDRLTGLSNRDAVIQRLTERMKKGRRHDDAPMMALLFVDLDRFKTVNDRFGHEAGDRVLLVMGKRLHDTVRDSDMVARWAGDEFVVLLDGVRDPSAPERVRAQIEEGLRQPVSVAEGQEPVTLGGSVGMALYPQDADEPADLIRLADEDMYRRKPVGATQW